MSAARENYKKIIDEYFGDGVCTINTSLKGGNDIIAALVHEQFNTFTTNFLARLKRLSNAYSEDNCLRTSIQQAINQVADNRNYDGAFSELTVLDYFLSFPDTGTGKIMLDVTVPATETLASEMGFTNANLDGYLSNYDVYFDTKVLSDKSGQIIRGIIDEAKRNLNISGLTIHPSFNTDLSFEEFQDNRGNLLRELINGVCLHSKKSYLDSCIISSLSYRLHWGAGVSTGVSEYGPIEHAENHYSLLFQHAKKFHRKKPTIIIFVRFPWFSETIPNFDGVRESFYSNFSKKFFYGHIGKADLGRDYNQKIISDILAADVAEHLSAIIFMDDHSALGDCNEKNHIEASTYFNEKAKNNLVDSKFMNFLQLNTKILN